MPLMLAASSGLIATGVPRSTTFRSQFSSPLPAAKSASGETNDGLQIGSPVVIVQAPPTLKTAVPMPSLKVNNGQVKAGDVGRIVSRKPKDVWAIRLAIGTYLIDGKHFRPLDLDNNSSEAA
ncbi:hypothetical protein IEQ34_015224 [Dendrobium chrysotoxum]|uniref:Chlororespiratory reduction 42 n=1 Tax=Dendrobium chrysotoxum TaxID=161865 RepID=A0AAV7GI81_DENCH|nr:hypothetical protein IEQ34_015224 [Dendrobium chrysotoxum]